MSSRDSVYMAICSAIKKSKHNQALDALFRLRSSESWALEEVLTRADARGRTLLMLAVEKKAAEVAQTLLEYGAPAAEVSGVRGSALHAAVANRDRFMLDLLLANGAVPWQADSTGRSAMDDAMATNWHDAQTRFRSMSHFSGLVQVKHSRLGGLACDYRACHILLTPHLAFSRPEADQQKKAAAQEHQSQMCLFICQDTDNTRTAIKLWLGDVVAKKSVPRGSHVLLFLRPDHPDPKGGLRWRRDEEGRITIKIRPVDLSAAAAAILNQLVDSINAAAFATGAASSPAAAGTISSATSSAATSGGGGSEIFQFPSAAPGTPRSSPASFGHGRSQTVAAAEAELAAAAAAAVQGGPPVRAAAAALTAAAATAVHGGPTVRAAAAQLSAAAAAAAGSGSPLHRPGSAPSPQGYAWYGPSRAVSPGGSQRDLASQPQHCLPPRPPPAQQQQQQQYPPVPLLQKQEQQQQQQHYPAPPPPPQQQLLEPSKQRKKWQIPNEAAASAPPESSLAATLCDWVPASAPAAGQSIQGAPAACHEDWAPSAPPMAPQPPAKDPVQGPSASAMRPWFLGGGVIPAGADGTVKVLSPSPSSGQKVQAAAQGTDGAKGAAPTSGGGGLGAVCRVQGGDPGRRGVEEGRCVICLVAQAQVGFLHRDTVHRAACWDCAQDLTAGGKVGPGGQGAEGRPCCPLCRDPIERVLAVY